MRFNTRRVLSLLAVAPSALAAINGACSNGVKGICISTGNCGNYGGTTSSGNCPSDPNDIKCCSNIPCSADGLTGSCMFTSECDGTTYSGLCPGGNDFKCCIRKTPVTTTGVGAACQGVSGTCIDVNTTACPNQVLTGKCPGPANVKCCPSSPPPVTGVGAACQGVSGTCIDVNTTACPNQVLTGKCPGPANVKCCPSSPPPVTGVGAACQGVSGTCIDVNTTGCPNQVLTGKCPGPANVKCCPSSPPPTESNLLAKVQKAADIARQNAKPSPGKECATYVRIALNQAGITFAHPGSACEYHSKNTLRNIGFTEISRPATFQKGDIIVFECNTVQVFGHIEIYDGSRWYSDFAQKSEDVYSSNIPPKHYYRVL